MKPVSDIDIMECQTCGRRCKRRGLPWVRTARATRLDPEEGEIRCPDCRAVDSYDDAAEEEEGPVTLADLDATAQLIRAAGERLRAARSCGRDGDNLVEL